METGKRKFNEEYLHFLNILILMLFPAINFIAVIFKFNASTAFVYYIFALISFIIVLMRFNYAEAGAYKRKIDKPIKLALIFLGLFLVWAVISTFFATDKKLALFDYAERDEGLCMYFAYALIFVGAFNIRSQGFKNKLLFAFQIFAIAVCVFGLLDFVTFQFGEKAFDWNFANPWSNPNHQAYFFAMVSPLSAVFMCFAKDKINKIVSIVSFTLCNFTLCLNNSFGGELSVLVTLILFVILGIIKDKSIWKMLLLSLGIFLATNALGYLVQVTCIKDAPTILQNYNEFLHDVARVFKYIFTGNAGDSGLATAGTGRWGLWYECFKNICSHPLFGIGINCQTVVNPNLASSRPHNELLQFASTMGVPSLLFYISALVCLCVAFARKFRTMNYQTFGTFFACVGYFVSSLFGVTLPYTFVYYIVFIGLLASSLNVQDDVS